MQSKKEFLINKMKKRIRKKKHLGEFRILGAEVLIKLNSKDAYDTFHNDFITHAIEGNDCFFGGGGIGDKIEGLIELGFVSDGPESRLKEIKEWLKSREDILTYQLGRITDAWYGPF